MTQQEFKKKLDALFTEHGINSVNTTNVPELEEISVLWANPQEDSIEDETVDAIGIDMFGELYIIFDGSGCTVFEDDLDLNRDFVWDNLYDAISNALNN
jgi:hypothetical protein